MSYAADVIFHVPFDSEPIVNSVSANFFTSIGSTPEIESAVISDGWKMQDDVYIQSSDTIFPTNKLTIGFYLKSTNPGVVTNPDNNATASLKIPVLSKATFSVSTSITTLAYTFLIWEETQQNGKNILKVKIKGTKNAVLAEATLTSSEYSVGEFRHYWIVYDGDALSLNLYANTIIDDGSVVSGTVPSSLSVNGSLLSINNNVTGELWEVGKNQGTIDDLVIFSSAKNNGNTIVRAANKGAIFVADAAYSDIDEIDHAIVFDDPGTAQISAVYSNQGRLYVARTDGKLLRGTKLLWESRREFGNNAEADNLNTVSKNASGFVRVSAGSLKIQDKIVRV